MKTLNMLPNISTGYPATGTGTPINLDFNRPFEGQIKAYFEGLGDPRGYTHVALVGQATAAGLALPALEMLGGLPRLALVPFQSREVAGWLDSRTFRHDVCRAMRRTEDTNKTEPAGYTVIDGTGRGLTQEQLKELAQYGINDIRVFSTNPGQVDIGDLAGDAGVKVAEGIRDAMVSAGYPINEPAGGATRLLFLPHGAGIVGTVQALALHGFTGAWPRTIRIAGNPAEGFHVREIVNPQDMRQWAIGLASRLEKAIPRVVLSGNAPDGFIAELTELAKKYGVEVG